MSIQAEPTEDRHASTRREPTVKDLVLAAGLMGCSISTVAPPPWSTKAQVDLDELSLSVNYLHEFKSGRFRVGIEKMIHKVDLGTEATIWWDSYDATGASAVQVFDVAIPDIPDLIVALQAAYTVVEGSRS